MRRRALLSAVLNAQSGSDIDDYFTIEALADGLTASLSVNDCEYCIDGDGDWKTLTANTKTEAINIGQTLSFRGNLIPDSVSGIGTFTISKNCSVKGNVMSLLFGDDGKNNFSLAGYDYAFCKLFNGQQTVIDASNLILPASILSYNCYSHMFQDTYITKTPRLPAKKLYENCYAYMFYKCTKLTTITNLDSTTLAKYCYTYMFSECTSLVKSVDILPATTLAQSCYQSMFQGCTSLTTAPKLPAITLASNCYSYMFYGCIRLNYIEISAIGIDESNYFTNWVYNVADEGTFIKQRFMILPSGASGIPEGWVLIIID